MNRNKKSQLFKEKYEKKFSNRIRILSEYKSRQTEIKITCSLCNHSWFTKPRALINSKPENFKCPNCKRIEFKEKYEKKFNYNYTIGLNYKSMRDSIEVTCNKCEHSWQPIARLLEASKNLQCPNCYRKAKWTESDFIKKLNKLHPNEYLLLSNFTGTKNSIRVKHECGYIREAKAQNILNYNCPNCSKALDSKGIQLIKNYLIENNYKYDIERPLCINPNTNYMLKMDIAVYGEGDEIYFIEFDGEQHFKPIEHWGGIETFKKNYEKDKIKNKYIESVENYHLLRIRFDEIELIETKLSKYLSNI